MQQAKSPLESLWMLLACVLLACGNALVKYATSDYAFYEVNMWRSLVGMLIAWCTLRAGGISLKSAHPWLHARRVAAGTTSALCGTLGISLLPLGTAQTCSSMAALFIGGAMVAAALHRRTRPEWGLLAALVIGFGGILLILDPSFTPGMMLGVAAGLGCSLFGAIAYWTISELGSCGEPGTRIVFYFMSGGVAAGIVIGLFFGFSSFHLKPFLAMIGSGCFFGCMQMAMTRSWARGHMLVTGTLQFSNIVFATLLGVVIFGDTVSLRTGTGILIVMACGIAATLMRLKAKKAG